MTYEGCFVDNTGGAMDVSTGVFNVTVSGVYQLSFTAKYVSSNLVKRQSSHISIELRTNGKQIFFLLGSLRSLV